MKKTLFRKVMCILLSATFLLSIFGFTVSAGSLKGNDTSSDLERMQEYLKASSYAAYYAKYHPENNPYFKAGLPPITVDVTGYDAGGSATLVKDNPLCIGSHDTDSSAWGSFGDFAAVGAQSVYLPASGSTTWRFHITQETSSLYYIKLEYYSCSTDESTVSSIERKLYIDGGIPFTEASYIKLNKNWAYTNVTEEELPADDPRPLGISYELTDTGYLKYRVSMSGGKKILTTYTIRQDINGNSMAPEAAQVAKWGTYFCQDSTGYMQGNFEFYFEPGDHTITLEAVREPMIIKSITLVPVDDASVALKSYAEVKASYEANGYTAPADGTVTRIEAEFPDMTSDSSVAPTNDNTSAATYPITSRAQLFNVIGENSYNTVGQWAAYKFTVSKTGLYKLGMRYKQSARDGMYICRTIRLSGGVYGYADGTPEVPFREAYDAQFNYNKEWQSSYISDSQGNVFEFYFEEGKEYTLYVECSLGSLRDLIARAEAALNEVNEDYLRILQLTGADPDIYQDYKFLEVMPDVLTSLLDQALVLATLADEFEALCGGKGSHIATLDTIALLLMRMGRNDGLDLAANMSALKSNLGTLGTWINNSKKSSMMVDCITVAPADSTELPKAKAGWFSSAWFEIRSFFASFFTNYDAMGLTTVPSADTPTIEVWLASGRDQSQIWRSMVDATDGFTDNTGSAVTLKLVTAGTLLPSILSGKGPDVYLGLGAADVINYAIRDAVLGVNGKDTRLTDAQNAVFTGTQYTYKDENGRTYTSSTPEAGKTPSFTSETFEDTVSGHYVQAAMDAITLLNVCYGIPMTMSFSMMFYRQDVLAKLGEEVPETWTELLSLLPVLQANNMSIGLNYEAAINIMLYQMGGNLWKYADNPEYAGAKIDLDSDISYEAFSFVCRLYKDYSFPVTYDAANRFRTGEMPVLVGDYISIYNQMVVFATEIDGLWSFTSLPGFKSTDKDKYGSYAAWGTHGNSTEECYYNYDSIANITATVMLNGCSNTAVAWQFMQWQTSAEVQANYGNRMVALIGPSAKYETANINAIKNLSWSASERAAINDQISHLSSVVNYPGSYIIARYTKFAFLNVKNKSALPVDALRQYIDTINAELKRKREEFGMKTLAPDEEPDYLTSK